MTAPSVLSTDNESLAMAAYHESICAFDLDILELRFPKLRRPKDVDHSCDGADCRICAPLMGRHKRVCAALGNVEEREQLAASMGTTKSQMERYGNGSGSVGQ